MQQTIERIDRLMAPMLNDEQASELHTVLVACLTEKGGNPRGPETMTECIDLFLAAKKLEGCSERSLRYYAATLSRFATEISKPAHDITTDDIRDYLTRYSRDGRVGKTTIDNIRRVISSCFSWLEEEDYIYKSPVRRIKKIRTSRTLKPVYSDESLEQLRDSCKEARDLAMIDLLTSTGIRVGELVQLNRRDIDSMHANVWSTAKETRNDESTSMPVRKLICSYTLNSEWMMSPPCSFPCIAPSKGWKSAESKPDSANSAMIRASNTCIRTNSDVPWQRRP